MKKFLCIALVLVVVALSNDASAGIRRIGLNQTYSTLTAAYTAAVNDDTLLISPGFYSETITVTKRLHWIGAGYDEVTVNGRLGLTTGSSGTRVEGLFLDYLATSDGVITIASGVDLILIKRCRLRNTATGGNSNAAAIRRFAGPGGDLMVESCILETNAFDFYAALKLQGDNAIVKSTVFHFRGPDGAGNFTAYAIDGTASSLVVEQCAFLNYKVLFNLTNSFPLSFRNNVIYDWRSNANWGIYPGDGAGWSFNASSTLAPPGTDGILLPGDPFVNYDETANYIYGVSDLHVTGSPCVDAGDPAVLDLDGSRSDMGIYGGPTPHVDGGAPNYPFTIAFDVPSSMTAGQQLPIQATGRIGAGY